MVSQKIRYMAKMKIGTLRKRLSTTRSIFSVSPTLSGPRFTTWCTSPCTQPYFCSASSMSASSWSTSFTWASSSSSLASSIRPEANTCRRTSGSRSRVLMASHRPPSRSPSLPANAPPNFSSAFSSSSSYCNARPVRGFASALPRNSRSSAVALELTPLVASTGTPTSSAIAAASTRMPRSSARSDMLSTSTMGTPSSSSWVVR